MLVIIAAALIARMITRPVRRITRAAEAIAAGKLDQQIPVRSDDEIGRLGRAFNEMSANVKHTVTDHSGRQDPAGRRSLQSHGRGCPDGFPGKSRAGQSGRREALQLRRHDGLTGHPLIEAVQDHEVDKVVRECLEDRH